MKGKFRNSIFYLCFLAFLLSAGCYSELSEVQLGNIKWSPELGVPLLDSKFTLTDILDANSDIIDYSVDANNTIVLSVSDSNLFTQNASEYYSLSDETINFPPIILTQQEIDLFNANGQVQVFRDIFIDYPSQGNLDQLTIQSGSFVTNVEEDFPANLDLSFSAQDPQNTTVVNYSQNFPYSGGDPFSTDQDIFQFNDISFQFNDDPRLGQIRFTFDLFLSRVDQDLVFGANSIDLRLALEGMEYDAMYGDLPTKDISTEANTINTDFFGDYDIVNEINYYFENPQFRVIFTNSMGLPVRFNVNNFTSYKDGQATDEPINNTFELASSEENSQTSTAANFDDIFKNLINDLPDSVSLQVDGFIDPDDSPENFITSNSFIRMGYEVNLPLEFSLSGFEINETVSLAGIDTRELQYALFKFTSENSLPIDLDFKADLLAEDSSVVMNLFDGTFLAGGTEEQPQTLSDIIRLEDDENTSFNELEDLTNVARVGIRARISTTNNGNEVVRITSNAAVKFNLAVQAKYNVNF